MPNLSAHEHSQKPASVRIRWEDEGEGRSMASIPPPSPEQGESSSPSSRGSGATNVMTRADLRSFPCQDNETPTTETMVMATVGPTKSSHPKEERKLRFIRSRGTKYDPNLTLVNSGSVARDHLANERTVLAYVRTSLALSSMGVALVQLFTLSSSSSESNNVIHSYARPLGATGVILGLFTLLIGVIRYFAVQSSLTKGTFPVARVTVVIVGIILTALISIVFGVLVAGRS